MQTYLPGFFFLFFPFASSHSSTSVWHTGTFSTLHPIYQHTNNTQVQLIKLTQLSPLLPPRQSIYPPHYLFKFYVCPPLRVRKIVPWEKDNNNLWHCTWVKCPGVMKQLQALTDGPCCKHASAPVTETPNRQMQRHNYVHTLSLILLQQHWGVSSHSIHLNQSFKSRGLICSIKSTVNIEQWLRADYFMSLSGLCGSTVLYSFVPKVITMFI